MEVGVVVPLDGSQVGVKVEEDRFRKAFLSKFKAGNSEKQKKEHFLPLVLPKGTVGLLHNQAHRAPLYFVFFLHIVQRMFHSTTYQSKQMLRT